MRDTPKHNFSLSPVVGGAHFADDPRVLLVVVVAVAGDLSVGAVGDGPLHLGPRVPDVRALAVRIISSFNLNFRTE